MISSLARRAARLMGSRLGADRDTEEVYAYGFDILFGALLEIFTILLLAAYLGYFYTTLTVLLFFALFRRFAGGTHLNTRGKCMVVGSVLIVGLGVLSGIPILPQLEYPILFIVLVFNLTVTYMWAPGGTAKKPFKDPKIRSRNKKFTLVMIVAWAIICLVLIRHDLQVYVMAAIYGSCSAMVLVTPLGYKLISMFDMSYKEGGDSCEDLRHLS